MKRRTIVYICIYLAFVLTGCRLGDIVDRFTDTEETVSQDIEEPRERIYIDEIKGILRDFTGDQITLEAQDTLYTFDVSQASLECEEGMVTGDTVSVIYEGRLSETDADASAVTALKVVDNLHNTRQLKDHSVQGEVQGLALNTITIKTKNGNIVTYPTTGSEQYYQNGIYSGAWVYLHFKGKYAETDTYPVKRQNASHLKVTSISDVEPFSAPAPAAAPDPSSSGETAQLETAQQTQAVIQNVNLNSLQVYLTAAPSQNLMIDMTGIPCYFKGGIAAGSHVSLTYAGELNPEVPKNIAVLAVTGEDPAAQSSDRISFTVTGVIQASTANTVTIQTADGAALTFHTAEADNTSTGGMAPGDSIRITFNPSESAESNIYTCIKIEDG